MGKSSKISILSTIVLVGFVIAVAFHYFFGVYLKIPYPYNTFLFDPHRFGTDFTGLMGFIKDFMPYQVPSVWVNYFPLAYLLLFPLTLFKNNCLSFLIFLIIFGSFWIPANIKIFKCENLNAAQNLQNIFILTFLSYPLLYLVDRGNFDMALLMMMTAFIYLFQSKRFVSSLIVLAVMNAIKPFFVIFLLLFLFEKKYKEIFLSIFLSAILIIGGFMLFKGGFFHQMAVFKGSLDISQKEFIYAREGGLVNSSSLFMSLKYIFCHSLNLITTVKLAKICGIIGLFITAITAFFAYKEKVFWKQIALLTLCMLTVSYIIFDYKLIFLFIPLWLFVNAKEKSKFDLIYIILFGLLLIPKRFLVLFSGQSYDFGLTVNPFIMLWIMGLIIYEQFHSQKQEKIDAE